MPMVAKYWPKAGCYFVQLAGELSHASLREQLVRIYHETKFVEAKRVVVDLRNLATRPREDEMQHLLNRYAIHARLRTKHTAFVTNPGAQTGVARYYIEHAGLESRAKDFRGLPGALTWLATR